MEKNENYIVLKVEDNQKYGLIKSAIIGRIRWWCEYNEKNRVKDRFYENYWWSGFMTAEEFSKQIGISKRTIEKNIQQLVEDGIIVKGVFNKKGFDRTSWYRLNTHLPLEGKSIYPDRVDHLPSESITIPVSNSVNMNVNKNILDNTSIILGKIGNILSSEIKEVLEYYLTGGTLTRYQKDKLIDNKEKISGVIPELKELIEEII